MTLHSHSLQQMSNLQWAGYLSTTAVYGGNEGKWIDEETDCVPDTQMGRVRLLVEDDWRRNGMFLPGPPTRVFRLHPPPYPDPTPPYPPPLNPPICHHVLQTCPTLPHSYPTLTPPLAHSTPSPPLTQTLPPPPPSRLGQMYGPGRGPLQAAKDRNALRVAREGHVASFVHVDDVAQVVVASMAAAESAPTALATAPTVSQLLPPRPHSSPDFSRNFRPFPTPPFCVCVFANSITFDLTRLLVSIMIFLVLR